MKQPSLAGVTSLSVPNLSATPPSWQLDVPVVPTCPTPVMLCRLLVLARCRPQWHPEELPNGLFSLVSSGKGGVSSLTFLTYQPSTQVVTTTIPHSKPSAGTWACTVTRGRPFRVHTRAWEGGHRPCGQSNAVLVSITTGLAGGPFHPSSHRAQKGGDQALLC